MQNVFGNQSGKDAPCRKLSGIKSTEIEYPAVISVYNGFGSACTILKIGASHTYDIFSSADQDGSVFFKSVEDILHVCSEAFAVSFPFKKGKTHAVVCPDGKRIFDFGDHNCTTFASRRVRISAMAILTASGRMKGNTHQPRTVIIPTEPDDEA